MIRIEQLARARHPGTLGDEFGGEPGRIEEGKPDPAALQGLLYLAALFQRVMAAERAIMVILLRDRSRCTEDGSRARRLEQIGEDELLPGNEIDSLGKALREDRIIQRGQEK